MLRDPLAELAARPKLLGTLHLVYFGLMMAASVMVYDLPDLQTGMLSVVKQAFTDPQSPLGVAAKAYGSQNIAWAAAVTFAINFFARLDRRHHRPLAHRAGQRRSDGRAFGQPLGACSWRRHSSRFRWPCFPMPAQSCWRAKATSWPPSLGCWFRLYLFERDKGAGVGQPLWTRTHDELEGDDRWWPSSWRRPLATKPWK